MLRRLIYIVSACLLVVLARDESFSADLPVGAKADFIKIEKAKHRLTLMRGNTILKEYRVALGPDSKGPKRREGDGKTPEGIYYIEGRNPRSAYHLSLRVSYPNKQDRELARCGGFSPGGDIMIHGIGKKYGYVGSHHADVDWTLGCIAVTNQEIEEIWRAVPNGAKVEILP